MHQALIHRSWANENGHPDDNNERLEYLGDSVLSLVINEYLFRELPRHREGQLSRLKNYVVAGSALGPVGRRLGIGSLLLLGKGEEATGGRQKESNLADAFEALIGALYLEGGLPAARDLILRHLAPIIQRADNCRDNHDFKTRLQEYCQQKLRTLPEYRTLVEGGPAHSRKFIVGVFIQDRPISKGTGTSKRQAGQKAARRALRFLSLEKGNSFPRNPGESGKANKGSNTASEQKTARSRKR